MTAGAAGSRTALVTGGAVNLGATLGLFEAAHRHGGPRLPGFEARVSLEYGLELTVEDFARGRL